MKCSRPGCEKPVHCVKLCRNHYVKSWRCHAGDAGKYRRVDPGPALEHLHHLRDLGWTWELIGQKSGLGPFTARHAFFRGTMSAVVSQAVLSLPLEEMRPPRRRLDPTGTRRRVEALNFMGWSRRELEVRMRMGVCALSKVLREGRVTPRTASLVAAVYDELNGIQGPSKQVADRAQLAGYHPPFAWDYVDIDDPKARPFQGFKEAA